MVKNCAGTTGGDGLLPVLKRKFMHYQVQKRVPNCSTCECVIGSAQVAEERTRKICVDRCTDGARKGFLCC